MRFYLHNSSEGLTIVIISIIYYVPAAKVVMVDNGSKNISHDKILLGKETVNVSLILF